MPYQNKLIDMRYFPSRLIFLFITSICFHFSCTKLPEDCSRFDNWTIISEQEKDEVCNYQQIYLYRDEYYSVCECCDCNKGEVVVDCNNEVFCDFRDGCLQEFYSQAEYLYSAVEEN